MEESYLTWGDLKKFIETLGENQLKEQVYISNEDDDLYLLDAVDFPSLEVVGH